jgi:hypothetical protein
MRLSSRFGLVSMGKRACSILDTRDVPQGSLKDLRELYDCGLIYRACDTLLPAVLKRDPMGMGYAGRDSETELGSWAGLAGRPDRAVGMTPATVDCYSP